MRADQNTGLAQAAMTTLGETARTICKVAQVCLGHEIGVAGGLQPKRLVEGRNDVGRMRVAVGRVDPGAAREPLEQHRSGFVLNGLTLCVSREQLRPKQDWIPVPGQEIRRSSVQNLMPSFRGLVLCGCAAQGDLNGRNGPPAPEARLGK